MVPALLAFPVTTGPAAPAPKPVRPVLQSLEVAGVDPAAEREETGSATGKVMPFLLTPKKATAPFTTVGVTWQPGTGSPDVRVLVRTRDRSGWSPWSALEVADDDGPDDTSAEAGRPGLRHGTAPQWVPAADGVQVRLDVPTGPQPRDVRVELIDPGQAPADATLGQTSPRSTAAAETPQPTIITRAQWGADESLRTAEPSYAPTLKVAYVHHTASTNDYTAEQAAAQVRGFYAYHTSSLGWSDIGYNFLVDKFGRIYEGRYGGVERAVIGAHAGGFNTSTVGVSMIGTYTSVAPTSQTLTSVQNLLAWKLSLSGLDAMGKDVLTSGGGSTSRYPAGADVTVNVISGHRDTNQTACPGDAGYSRLPGIRLAVANRIATLNRSPIDAKHEALGGSTGLLGSPTTAEAAVLGGRNRHYQNGSIYWSTITGAKEIHGPIHGRWAELDWERSVLGLPTTDQLSTPNGIGQVNHFQAGSIFWTAGTGAHEVRGAIRDRWAATGWESGPLGFPATNELTTPNGVGRVNHFQGGSIFWTPGTGAQDVRGPIRGTWAALGWEGGMMGFPTSGQLSTPNGVGLANHFQGGSIFSSPATGAREVTPGIRDAWARVGWENGRLGFPTTHQLVTPDSFGRVSHFQGGSIFWSPATGAHAVDGGIRNHWASTGWERGGLGYPVSDAYPIAEGFRQDFQGGRITWIRATGSTMVTS